jgi:putative AlgH/UPF0301 family transcriptional regulator
MGKGRRTKLSHNLSAEQASAAPGGKNLICAFVGYAGWGAGQLETEVKQKAWLLKKAKPSLLKLDRLPNLWFDIMRSLGPWQNAGGGTRRSFIELISEARGGT